jgi:hypothetical protein
MLLWVGSFIGSVSEGASKISDFVAMILASVSAIEISKRARHGLLQVVQLSALSIFVFGALVYLHAVWFGVRIGMVHGGVGGVFDYTRVYVSIYGIVMCLLVTLFVAASAIKR